MHLTHLTVWLVCILELCEAALRPAKLPKRRVSSGCISECDTISIDGSQTAHDLPQAQTISVPIDHFNVTDTRTYQNRFWVNDTYYQPGGPVFFIDAGENGVLDVLLESYLTEENGRAAGVSLAREYNGLAVLWEHRFYGDSLPFPVDRHSGLAKDGWDAYQYLTVDQALQDAVHFAHNFMPAGMEDHWDELHPSRAPWIWIGSSYAGARAAFARIAEPDTFFASWASSAPVQATIDFSTYYEQLSTDMTSNCSADIHAAISFFDSLEETGTQKEIMTAKAMLYIVVRGDAVDLASMTGMSRLRYKPIDATRLTMRVDERIRYVAEKAPELWQLATILEAIIPQGFQTYGFEHTMLPVCNRIETFDPRRLLDPHEDFSLADMMRHIMYPSSSQATDNGLAAKYGAEAAWYGLLSALFNGFGGDDDTSSSGNYRYYSADAMSWQYQTCSEMGFYQVANPASQYNVLSESINVTSWQAYECDHLFGYPAMPKRANVSRFNEYGGWYMQPSNVMFTNGLKDPWHTVGVQSASIDIGAPNRTTTQDIPACNQAPSNGDVFGLLYPNGYHASDMVDFAPHAADESRRQTDFDLGIDLFEKALDAWLPCFEATKAVSNKLATQDEASDTLQGLPTPSTITFNNYVSVDLVQLIVLAGLIIAMVLAAIW